MKRFTAKDTPSSWSEKINYVDQNNRVLGYDMQSSCCESFGHGVYATPFGPENEDELIVDLTPYTFVDEPHSSEESCSTYDCGSAVAFRISAPNLPDLYVRLWNSHNGYYSHGFTAWNAEGSL
jgi:hypothetical protein